MRGASIISWQGKTHVSLAKYFGIPLQLYIGRIYTPEDEIKKPKPRAKRIRQEIRRYEPVMEGEKRCRVCRDKKSVLEFHRDARQKDGRRSNCAECKNEQAKQSMNKLRAMKSA